VFRPPGPARNSTNTQARASLTGGESSEVVRFDELLNDEHLEKTGMFYGYVHPTEGRLWGVGIPTRFSRTPGSIRSAAPAFTPAERAEP
jgi:crotonobetainyl-CoA:carnitine CoA-transferase CaiB-like acyl-CoA transferase